jgi:hypothetical protein
LGRTGFHQRCLRRRSIRWATWAIAVACLSAAAQAAPPNAAGVIEAAVGQLVYGPPLVVELRVRTEAAGEQTVASGSYVQAGQGSGRQRYELRSVVAGGPAVLVQISDGRLAWTRRQVADNIELRRVELGRLPSGMANAPSSAADPANGSAAGGGELVPPRFRVLGFVELLDNLARDYELTVRTGTLRGAPVLILSGPLREAARQRVRDASEGEIPDDLPTEVWIALSPTNGTPALFPLRIEYRQPDGSERGRVITAVEILSIKQQPVDDRNFLYDSQELDVTLINETDRYIRRFAALPEPGRR